MRGLSALYIRIVSTGISCNERLSRISFTPSNRAKGSTISRRCASVNFRFAGVRRATCARVCRPHATSVYGSDAQGRASRGVLCLRITGILATLVGALGRFARVKRPSLRVGLFDSVQRETGQRRVRLDSFRSGVRLSTKHAPAMNESEKQLLVRMRTSRNA